MSQIHQNQLAELCGLSVRQLHNLAKAGHIPQPTKSAYPTTETIQSLFTYFRERSKRTDSDYAEQKAKSERFRAELLELERDEKRKNLVPMEEVQKLITQTLLPVRQSILSLPAEQANQCNPTDPQLARKALQRWVDYRFLPSMRRNIRDEMSGKSTTKRQAKAEKTFKKPSEAPAKKAKPAKKAARKQGKAKK